jgi:NADH-quinone oxidoreductase subunit N
MMLSLAGIPLTAGFMAKLYVFAAAARSGLWLLLVVAVVNSGMAAYYYLRVLTVLYSPGEGTGESWPRVRPASGVALGVLSVLLVLFGLFPGPLVDRAEGISRRFLQENRATTMPRESIAPSRSARYRGLP